MTSAARVAIGVPIYNGSRTLRGALDSLLAQDHPHIRIVISDNGSTDDSGAIVADYVRRHPHIEYHRVDDNRGAIWNFNRVFELRGDCDYFCWSAHDDKRAPTYISRAVAVLDADPAAALCHSQVLLLEPGVAELTVERAWLVADSPSPRARFAATLDARPWHLLAYGLMRVSLLERTQLYRNLVGADLALLADLALYGSFAQIPEPLFTYRLGSDQNMQAYYQRLQKVLDPSRDFGRLQSYRLPLGRAHLESLRRAPLSATEKLAAVVDLVRVFGLSHGTLDELLRIVQALIGIERFDKVRAWKRRLLGSAQR